MKLDSAITVTLVVCALITTGIVVRREFVAVPAVKAQTEQKPSYLKDWRTHLATGVRMGPSEAPVQLIEFADFECPYCGTFHREVTSLRGRYPTQVSVTFVHFPLPMHRFAVPAARAAECAGEQGHFREMYDQLFDQQDQFGLKPWTDFATDAGVPDRAAFETCIQNKEPVPRITQGQELGKQLDVQGTPTIVINGWKLGRPPTAEELDKMVKLILAGKSPVDGKS